ncbi:MAG TPA: hypothetical protein PLD48_01640 [Bacillota bacterium]|nr:hypothetical protein [Bacillota bacterium]HOK69021.1 hypothetical protein [Bacillota bacterium]HPP84623.1 hypothetical protein [Bacillota bacterium]
MELKEQAVPPYSDDSALAEQHITRRVPSVVYMEKLYSEEHYLDIGCEPRPILRNINIDIKKGEIWGILGRELFDLKLLLEIMANIKPYYSGTCQLLERGMFKNKRIIHPDLFYFASTSMAYTNMKVLEFLMFTTANSSFDQKTQAERLSDQLFLFGLGGIRNTPIYKLSSEYKSIVLLLAGYFSSNRLIIMNLPTLIYNEEQRKVLKNIAEKIRSAEQTLVFSTMDETLIEKVCGHTAYLKDGTFLYAGAVETLIKTYDKVVMTVKDPDVRQIKRILSESFPDYMYRIDDDVLYISSSTGYGRPRALYERIVMEGYAPNDVKINNKTLQNAIKELTKQNYVYEQLFL